MIAGNQSLMLFAREAWKTEERKNRKLCVFYEEQKMRAGVQYGTPAIINKHSANLPDFSRKSSKERKKLFALH
jgi:hypothetical protein